MSEFLGMLAERGKLHSVINNPKTCRAAATWPTQGAAGDLKPTRHDVEDVASMLHGRYLTHAIIQALEA